MLLFSCRVRQFKLEQVVIIVVITAAWVTPHSQFILSMDQEVWRGERGGFYFHFITIAHKKSPLLESIKHWNSIPALPCLSNLICPGTGLRLLSPLTILTWKKISNKDICDPIRQFGPHSPGAPLGIYCYGNDVICKLTSSSSPGRHLHQRYQRVSPLVGFQTFYGHSVVSVHMKDLKATRRCMQGSAKLCESFPKCES